MIVTTTVNQLRKRIVDISAYHYRFAEIHRSAFHGFDTGRDQSLVHRVICIRIDHDRMIHDLRAGNTGKVEITMVCQIHDSRFIRRSLVLNINGVIIRQLIDHLDIQITGETCLTVFR